MAEPLFRPEVTGFQRFGLLRRPDDSEEIVIRVSRFAAERERFYRDRFKKAPESEKGRIAVAFLGDAPPGDWGLANWLFVAIGDWQRSPSGSVQDKNLKLVTREMGKLYWGRPEVRARLMKHRNESRQNPQVVVCT